MDVSLDRLLEHVERLGRHWINTAGRDIYHDGRRHNVRRQIYMWFKGPISPNENVVVKCGYGDCVHPDCMAIKVKNVAHVDKGITEGNVA